MKTPSPQTQLASFIARYTPEVATLGRAVLAKFRQLLPPAIEMVYDNYNFLVAGFAPNDRPSDAVLSIALSARGVNLCFLQGAGLPDPMGLLRGSGSVARNIRLASIADLDSAPVAALIDVALDTARVPFDPARPGRFTVKSVSAKKRPRRR